MTKDTDQTIANIEALPDGRRLACFVEWEDCFPTDNLTTDDLKALTERLKDAERLNAESILLTPYEADCVREALRITMNTFHSHKKETALDRLLCRASNHLETAVERIKEQK